MSLLKKIKNKILNKLASSLYYELKRIDKAKLLKEKKQHYTEFKKFGPDSFLWGERHIITGKEYCEIGANVHINDNAYIRAEGGLEIGDNTHISRNLLLYTINHDFKGGLLPYDHNMIKKKVVIGKNVWIGMNVCITPGTQIGDGCIVGMGSTVSGIIPPLSIIASPKATIIGERDEKHYEELENNHKYGGPNGIFYNWSKNSVLKNIGDKFQSRRSVSELIEWKGQVVVKKTYLQTEEASKAFGNELLAYKIFQKYSWCPKLLDSGPHFTIVEFFSSDNRLDIRPDTTSKDILGEILFSLLDIFAEGYAHCDFHAKNIFIEDSGVKIIDFETLQRLPEKVDFFESYDIRGKGLESPFLTMNMCVMSKDPVSISSIFKINTVEELHSILENRIKEQMLDTSSTFKSRRSDKPGRHILQTKNIYSVFDLKYVKVSPEEGQRNTFKRFERFGISAKDIAGKTVLDIGSNIGGTLSGLSTFDATEMIGLEFDTDKVTLSNKLAKLNGITNMRFVEYDIESGRQIPELKKYDVVFCLAVVEHLTNKEALFKVLNDVTESILYFEGNGNSDVDFIQNQLLQNGFSTVNFIGNSDDEKNIQNNNRPLFVAYK